MTDPEDGSDDTSFVPVDDPPSADVDDTPTVSCSLCDRTWELDYELDELQVGNQAVEQFALDHQRHTGHFPDDVTPWVVDCKHCHDEDVFLTERPARRWARTHVRHTAHTVSLSPPDDETTVVTDDRSGDH